MTHKIPRVVESLGTILDLTVTHGAHRLRIDEWKAWQLLAPVDAMHRTHGAGKLYLVAHELGDDFDPTTTERLLQQCGETYGVWHQRDAERVRKLETGNGAGVLLGRVERIGYRSDKFGRRGRTHDYDHDFRERGGKPPKLWIDAKTIGAAKTAVISGGDFVVRAEGIC